MDQVAISGNQNMVIHAGSTLKHEMTFETGVHFEKVISVLRSVPIGFNTISVSAPGPSPNDFGY